MHNHWLQNFSHSNVQAHFCLKCTNWDNISDEICDLVHVKFNLSPPNNKEGPAEHQSFFWVEWVFNPTDDLTDKFNRVHLTTRKQLQNISYSFGSNGFLNDTDDAQSVKLWVEEIRKSLYASRWISFCGTFLESGGLLIKRPAIPPCVLLFYLSWTMLMLSFLDARKLTSYACRDSRTKLPG